MKTVRKSEHGPIEPRKIPFLSGVARIWQSTWGSGITAREGYLITSGSSAFPRPVAWADSFEEARALLDGKLKFEDVVDLRSNGWIIPPKIGENLLFPVHPRTGMIDADDDNFAAAHFVFGPISPAPLAFCILTRRGLDSVNRNVWRVEHAHAERSERMARR